MTYKKILASFSAIVMFGIFVVQPVEAAPQKYSSCAKLRKAYPRGVAISKSKAKKTKATVSRNAYRTNKHLDTNNNGIACEKGEKRAAAIPGSFGSGTKIVGAGGISPGRYMSVNADTCYWERLSGFSGSFDQIIANENPKGSHVVVDIAATDVGFNSSRCGTWYPYSPTPTQTIGDGTWVVNDEIAPGIWSTTFSDFCYWERLSGFSGSFDQIIANDLPTSTAIVEILSTDVGFSTGGCGIWTKIG